MNYNRLNKVSAGNNNEGIELTQILSNAMKYHLLKKKLKWAVSIVVLLGILVISFWFYPLTTLILLVTGWLALMLYLDPPNKWDL